MNKAYSADSLDRVKKGLQSNVFRFIDDQINDIGIDEALQNCNGNVSKAIIYYAGQHYKGVPGYSGDDCNGDSIYLPSSAKRRSSTTARAAAVSTRTKRAPAKSTNNRFTHNKSKSTTTAAATTTTTNNKTSPKNNGSSKSQRSGGKRKRGSPSEGDEGKLLHIL